MAWTGTRVGSLTPPAAALAVTETGAEPLGTAGEAAAGDVALRLAGAAVEPPVDEQAASRTVSEDSWRKSRRDSRAFIAPVDIPPAWPSIGNCRSGVASYRTAARSSSAAPWTSAK